MKRVIRYLRLATMTSWRRLRKTNNNQRWALVWIFEGIICTILAVNGIGIKIPLPESCYPAGYNIQNIPVDNITGIEIDIEVLIEE